MISRIEVPRINANEDVAKAADVPIAPGQPVKAGDELMTLETYKAIVSITSPRDGVIRALYVSEGEDVLVGQTLLIIADSMDEAIPETEIERVASDNALGLTGKARVIARRLGLTDADLTGRSGKITVADVYAMARARDTAFVDPADEVDGAQIELGPVQERMMQTVRKAARTTVPAYLEMLVDTAPLARFVHAQWGTSPLIDHELALVAFAFIRCLARFPAFNTALIGDKIVQYKAIHLAFAVETREGLFMPVLHDAGSLDRDGFIRRLFDLQKRMFKKRDVADLVGATVGFTSLAAFGVTRHQPILFPGTSIMLAHSAPLRDDLEQRPAVLGVSYDHQLHTGVQVAKLLRVLRDALTSPDRLH